MNFDFKQRLKNSGIIPVAAFLTVDDSLRFAEVLLKNSLMILEVTLRTESAFACIEAVSREFPRITVGAGSILSGEDVRRVCDSGALFGVSPVLDLQSVEAAAELNLPFVPGVSTPTEFFNALKKVDVIKVFPASSLGGPSYIRGMTAPFKMKEFHLIPTGGVNEKNYLEYMSCDSVIACGMSYIAQSSLIQKGEFVELEKRIRRVLSGLKSTGK
jgi:2-dehydro-3-deoxyphosphogluconate aldolase / (4S)-4-hydroxy-2-oxoglutarate aldolase